MTIVARPTPGFRWTALAALSVACVTFFLAAPAAVRDGVVQEGWGLHLIDVNLAMDNLVDLVGKHADEWSGSRAGAAP
ncbi:MAG TPA: hypothetical protein VMT85_22135 [Thermoanaerobaculia bacterium]|nr:hypothetical protein [Thermoanaerobaculia bacterium]